MDEKMSRYLAIQKKTLAHKYDGGYYDSDNNWDDLHFPCFDDMFHLHNAKLLHHRRVAATVDMAPTGCNSLDLNAEC